MSMSKTRDELVKRIERVKLVALCVIVLGVFGTIYCMGAVHTYNTVTSDDHLTDPDTPVSALNNATYTFTAKEVGLQMTGYLMLVIASVVAFNLGYYVLILGPRQKHIHQAYCRTEEYGPCNYCPECGLKLKKPEGSR